MLPIYHVHGLFIANHCALLNGSAMLFEPRFDAERMLKLLPQATVFMGVPTYYVRLLNEAALSRALCAHIRLFISGSAPLLKETFEEFRKRTGHVILERYGMTEGGMFSSNPYTGERRSGTVGFPLPDMQLRIVDATGNPVANGEIGMIEVKGENVFCGYLRAPEKMQESMTADGFFRTGDLGTLDTDGYLSIVGRVKDLVISGGLNVYPKEIELLIDALDGVAESAVIGLPHADLGEAVAAIAVPQNNAAGTLLSPSSIISALTKEIAGFKVPKRVILVERLPRNSMGKVQKNLLREEYRYIFSPDADAR